MSRRATAAALTGALLTSLLVGVAPAAVATIAPPELAAATVDTDGDVRLSWAHEPGASGYTVQVATTPDFAAGTVLATAQTFNRTWVPPTTLTAGDTRTLYWRVAAHTTGTTAASQGAWSTPEMFDSAPTAVPSLVGPGTAWGGTVLYPDPVVFTWDGVPGATGYTLQYSSSPAFPADATTTTVTTTGTAHAPVDPLPRVSGDRTIEWHWRVRANFWTGTTTSLPGDWSHARSFSVVWPADRSAPVLESPAHWQLGAPAVSDVRLTWHPVAGASSYEVTVGVSLDSGGSVTGVVAGASGTTTATAFVPQVALLDQNYYWQVTAVDASGNRGARSEVRQFRKVWGAQTASMTTPGAQITAPVPHQGTADAEAPTALPLDQFLLSWDPVPRATLYEVQVTPVNGDPVLSCRTASTSATIIGASLPGEQTPAALKGAGTCLWTGTEKHRIQPGRTYRWRVRAVDYSGGATTQLQGSDHPTGTLVSEWSDPQDAGFPGRARYVHVVAPVGQVGPTAEPDATAFAAQREPALEGQPAPLMQWNPVEGADGYEVRIALNESMTNQVAVLRTPSTRLRVNGVFEDNVTGLPYYWQVRPFQGWGSVPTYIREGSATKPWWVKQSRPADFVDTPASTTRPDGTVLLGWRPQAASAPLDGGSRGYQLTLFSSGGEFLGATKVEYPFAVAAHPTSGRALAAGTYRFAVAPLDANGSAGRSSAQQSFTVAGPPPTTRPAEVAPAAAVLSWSTSAAAARYEVQYWNTATPASVVTRTGLRQSAVALVDLVPGTYGWRVRSLDRDGNQTAWSGDATFTVEGRAPQLRTSEAAVLATAGRVLDWAPVPGASRYLVQVATSPGALESTAPVETRATAFAPTAAVAYGTTYYWRVRAVGEKYGSATTSRPTLGTSDARAVSFRTVPVAPTTSTPVRSGRDLTVGWTPLAGAGAGTDAPVSYVVRYRVKATPENPWVLTPPTAGAAASRLLTGLRAGTVYQTQVSALSPEGQGPWSAVREATTATVPAAPSSLALKPGSRSLTVSWGTASDGGAALTGYRIRYRRSDVTTWTTTTVTPTTRSITLTGLSGLATYVVEVAGTNAVGTGVAATAQTKTFAPPSAPTSVKVVRGDRRGTVSWAPPTSTGGSPVTG
ncbi:MAG: fibronectin type III domain-containing protein, partial [Actinotalea sp.]|nr:fibronectin type III domain-containing protein [Actinotalea sp.]